jgi:hypothetical protein
LSSSLRELAAAFFVWQDHSLATTAMKPYKGDSDTNGVALKLIDKNTIEETAKLNGKAVCVTRLTVAPDGRSMIVP